MFFPEQMPTIRAAPSPFAIWHPAKPQPPLAPMISIVEPSFIFPASRNHSEREPDKAPFPLIARPNT
ncbi:hypothetical protein ACHAWO_007180 [Cyclotella atomus]|uniref:Uncharacterized protein n=1 Tax=Cyclotella atomus TaxID=382360 RepID=A0ABD3N9B4_9STRA